MSTCATIRPISYSEILSATNSSDLISAYAAECSVPDADPQVNIYEAMEKAGALQCFGAYLLLEHPLDPPTLIGFGSVVFTLMPHNGKRLATLESLFVLPAHRKSGAGDALLSTIEDYAETAGCVAVIYTSRIGSRLEKILLRRSNCIPSHSVYTRWL